MNIFLLKVTEIHQELKYRSSRPDVFCKKVVLRNFAKFTGKHVYQSLFLIKLPEACNFIKKETMAQMFSCEFCEISRNTFSYRAPPVAASESRIHILILQLSSILSFAFFSLSGYELFSFHEILVNFFPKS